LFTSSELDAFEGVDDFIEEFCDGDGLGLVL